VHPQEFWKDLWETVTAGKTWRGKICNRNKAGEIFWEETTINPIWNERGEIESFFAVRFDITDQVRQNESLKLYQKEQSSLLENTKKLIDFRSRIQGIIAHDLRTPLSQMVGLTELAKEEYVEQESREELLIEIAERCKKTLEDVDELLLLQKQGHQLSESKTECFVPCEIIEEEVQAHQFAINNKRLRVSKSLKCTSEVEGPKLLFLHIVRNLVSNAIKYTPPKGRISIEYTTDSSKAVLIISDSGKGIPESEREKVFQNFYSDDSTSDTSSKSWGLGLAFVYDVILSIGGKITIDDSKWDGAKFTAELPVLVKNEITQ
jgi:signal transduction histidine kinase